MAEGTWPQFPTIVLGQDMAFGIAKGHVLGHQQSLIGGFVVSVTPADGIVDIWDQGGVHTHLSDTGETAYISSTVTADKGITVFVDGLDEDWKQKTLVFALNASDGQTKTAIGDWAVIHAMGVVGAVAPTGIIYIYANDTVTAGAPQTQAKIQGKMLIGENLTHNGWLGVAGDFTGFFRASRHHLATDAVSTNTYETGVFHIVKKLFGNVPLTLNKFPVHIGSGYLEHNFSTMITVESKAIIEFKIQTVLPAASSSHCASILSDLYLIRNDLLDFTGPLPRFDSGPIV